MPMEGAIAENTRMVDPMGRASKQIQMAASCTTASGIWENSSMVDKLDSGQSENSSNSKERNGVASISPSLSQVSPGIHYIAL